MIRQLDGYARYFERGAGDRPDDDANDFTDIVTCHHDDPEKALAYVVIAASRSDDPRFLGYFGCGPLEDVLRDPSPELLDRIVAEAGKSARFRWLLSHRFRLQLRTALGKQLRSFASRAHEEPSDDTLPPRRVN
jgi:hypothetical protein